MSHSRIQSWIAATAVGALGAAMVLTTVRAGAEQCSSHAGPAAAPTASGDIVETARSAGGFGTLLAAAEAAGLVDTLRSQGPLTVFAPNDEAFAALPEGTVESLLVPENVETLRAILTYHVVPGRLSAEDVVARRELKSAEGRNLTVRTEWKHVHIDDATVIAANVPATNGVIHVIDAVLLPKVDLVETATSAGSFKTLLAAAGAAGLVDTLKGEGPLTVFAPTDEAFAKLPDGTLEILLKPENVDQLREILTLHVAPGRLTSDLVAAAGTVDTASGSRLALSIAGGRARIGGAAFVQTDVLASNGVIHVIDEVLLPDEAAADAGHDARGIIETAISRGVPMFNHGAPAACAAVYEAAAMRLLGDDTLTASVHRPLQMGLHKARGMHDARGRAWALRHALDAAYREMTVAAAGGPMSGLPGGG